MAKDSKCCNHKYKAKINHVHCELAVFPPYTDNEVRFHVNFTFYVGGTTVTRFEHFFHHAGGFVVVDLAGCPIVETAGVDADLFLGRPKLCGRVSIRQNIDHVGNRGGGPLGVGIWLSERPLLEIACTHGAPKIEHGAEKK